MNRLRPGIVGPALVTPRLKSENPDGVEERNRFGRVGPDRDVGNDPRVDAPEEVKRSRREEGVVGNSPRLFGRRVGDVKTFPPPDRVGFVEKGFRVVGEVGDENRPVVLRPDGVVEKPPSG